MTAVCFGAIRWLWDKYVFAAVQGVYRAFGILKKVQIFFNNFWKNYNPQCVSTRRTIRNFSDRTRKSREHTNSRNEAARILLRQLLWYCDRYPRIKMVTNRDFRYVSAATYEWFLTVGWKRRFFPLRDDTNYSVSLNSFARINYSFSWKSTVWKIFLKLS